jgi:hypothetical protein
MNKFRFEGFDLRPASATGHPQAPRLIEATTDGNATATAQAQALLGRVLRFRAMRIRRTLLLLIVCLAWSGCNRNMEPYVPGEEPKQPDLSRIFPVPAEERAAPVVAMPAAPGQASAARGIPPQPKQGANQGTIQGTIRVAPELADRIPEAATLFVIVRPGDAGPPLAVKRIELPNFPFEFSVGPEDRMVEARPFQGPLTLTARLDSDGNAGTRGPGDIQGRYPDPVDPGTKSLEFSLDELL